MTEMADTKFSICAKLVITYLIPILPNLNINAENFECFKFIAFRLGGQKTHTYPSFGIIIDLKLLYVGYFGRN